MACERTAPAAAAIKAKSGGSPAGTTVLLCRQQKQQKNYLHNLFLEVGRLSAESSPSSPNVLRATS